MVISYDVRSNSSGDLLGDFFVFYLPSVGQLITFTVAFTPFICMKVTLCLFECIFAGSENENETEIEIEDETKDEIENETEEEMDARLKTEAEMLESIGKKRRHRHRPSSEADEEKDESEDESDESRPITVKYYRTKGKTMEDLNAARAAGIVVENFVAVENFDKKSCPKEGCADVQPTERPTVRYFRRKGTPIGAAANRPDLAAGGSADEIFADDDESESESEPETTTHNESPTKFERIETVGSIRYVRRKGVPLGSQAGSGKGVDGLDDDEGDAAGSKFFYLISYVSFCQNFILLLHERISACNFLYDRNSFGR